MQGKLELGRSSEDAAVDLLERQGYRVIARNFRKPFGEVDVVALDRDTVCFIEVKARRSEKFGLPQEAVSSLKQKRIMRVALAFLKERRMLERKVRFDVVALACPAEGRAYRAQIIKAAFSEG